MNSRRTWIINWINVFFSLAVIFRACARIQSAADEGCRLPKEWRGRWFWNAERPLGDVTIKDSEIEGIGQCVSWHKSDYYIIREKDNNLYKCLLVIRRDVNVLQYRESHAVSHRNFEALCRAIRVENILYTLVRAAAHPIECPSALRGQFSITYRNNTDVLCISSKSRMTTCASGKHMRFQYGACPGTRDEEYTVECLSSWKDSVVHLYASINYGTTGNKPPPTPVHRCFIIVESGPDVSMSVSVDTSCQPHMSLTLKKQTSSPYQPSCSFPSWMQGLEWLDFEGESIYHLNDSEMVVHKYRDSEDTGRVIYRYSCLSASVLNGTEVVMHVNTAHRCASNLQCIRFKRLSADTVEFLPGEKTETSNPDCIAVMSRKSNTDNKILLVKENVNRVDKCLFHGLYKTATSITDPNKNQCNISTVHVGCTVNTVLTLYNTDRRGQISPEYFRCVAQWTADSMKYIVIRSEKSETHTCIVLHTDGYGNSVISVNKICTHNKGNICEVVETIIPCPSKTQNGHSKVTETSEFELTLHGTDIPPVPPHSHCALIHNCSRYTFLSLVISYLFYWL